MQSLITELTTYFAGNKNKLLKDFLPQFKKVFNPEKILLKNENIYGTYSRNTLFRNDFFEIIFITWGAKSKSPIHDHPENGCILTVLDGNLIEERYNPQGELYSNNFLKSGDIGYMENYIGKHRITNPNDRNVYSFHIYSPSGYYDNDKCNKN